MNDSFHTINPTAERQINDIRIACEVINPLVVILCITYNHDRYIRDALEGFVKQQTDFPFVAIVHDDASTDTTAAIIKEYAEKYPYIILPIYENENQYSKRTLGSIMNKASCETGAKYIAICEGDDFWIDPLKLQKQVDFLESNNDFGMCYTNFDILNQQSGILIKDVFKTLPKKYIPVYESPEEFVYRKGYVCPPSWVFRKECLPDNSIVSMDETFVYFTHFLVTTKVKYLDDVTSTYRVLEESASHSSDINRILEREDNIFQTQIKLIEKYNLDKSFISKCEEQHYIKYLPNYIIINNKKEINNAKLIIKNKSLKVKVLFIIANLKAGKIIQIFRNIKSALRIKN